MRACRRENGRPRRVLTGLLVLVLLITLVCQSFAAGSEPAADPEKPVVTVVAVGVEGGKYLEVGLNVDSRGNNFHVLGAVLEYNSDLLTPVQSWDDNTPADLDGTVGWGGTRALPAKGPDDLSGKTALATRFNDEAKAYVYLSAESPVIDPRAQSLPELKGEPLDGWATAAGPVAEAVAQVVTIRFLLNVPEGGDAAAVQKDAVRSIKLVTGGVAANSPVNDHSGVAWLHNANGEALNVEMKYAFVGDGISVYGGKTMGSVPIVFYDWDGLTLLGAHTVDKVDDPERQQKLIQNAMDAFTDSIMKGGYNPATYNVLTPNYDATVDAEGNPVYPLNNKDGYSFKKWIALDSAEYTSYGDAVSISNATQAISGGLPEPADMVIDPSDLEKGLTVKAVYRTNTDMNGLTASTTAADRYYSLSFVKITDNDRFGTTGNYSLTFRVSRNDVHRTRKLALRVTMVTTENVSIFSLVPLDNRDEVTTEIVPNTDIKTVKAVVIDIGGVTNWVNGTVPRSKELVINKDGADGFVVLGNVGAINKAIPTGAALPTLLYSGAGLNTSNPYGAAPDASNSEKRAQALINIRAAWQQKNPGYQAGDPYIPLTQEELQNAIDHGVS